MCYFFPSVFQSLNSKQRTMRKNGNDLNESDQIDLDRVSQKAQDIQKTLEKVRKQSRQHAMLVNDHQNRKNKAMGIDPSKDQVAGGPQMNLPPGAQPHPQQGQMMMQGQGPMQPGQMMPQQRYHRVMTPNGPRMMVLQQQQGPPGMRMQGPQGQPMQLRMMQQHPGGPGVQQRMVVMQQHPQQRMTMMRMPQGPVPMRMPQQFPDQQQQQNPQMSPAQGMSPHNSNQPSPHSIHSGQPSPQSYPVTSPNATPVHGRPGMTSPMNMPVTSPSSQNVMSPMNPPSQSPQPSMSPQHFNQQQQHQHPHFSGSQSPAQLGQSPRNVSSHLAPVFTTRFGTSKNTFIICWRYLD